MEEISLHELWSRLGWLVVPDQMLVLILGVVELVEVLAGLLDEEVCSILSNLNAIRRVVDHFVGLAVHLAPLEVVLFNNKVHTKMRSEEHTSELKSLMRISYAVF